jgi:site-specific DNA-methyltransferase (adenine-specific)
MANNYTTLSQIVVPPDRQRQDHDIAAHQDLVESIRTNGLINAITLTPIIGTDTWELVAGERRLRAMTDLVDLGEPFKYNDRTVPSGMIPFTFFSELSALEKTMLEFEENIKRKDLTWQERSAAVGKIAEMVRLRAIETGTKFSLHDVTDLTASANLGSDFGLVRQDLIIAKNLDNPLLKGVTSRSEAFKVLNKEATKKQYLADAARIGPTLHATSYQVINADCLEWLATAPAGSFDVVLTDPPYGMGADEFGDSGGKNGSTNHFYADTDATVIHLMQELPAQLFRVTKADAHLYLFCDVDFFSMWKDALARVGWNVFRTPMIWYKPQAFRAPWPEHGPQRKYEMVLYARKGDKRCNTLSPDVLTHAPDINLGHQAQKPVSLFADLLRRSVRPGENVLDPFCGTGPVFEAAHACSCKATGIELDSGAYGIALSRVNKLVNVIGDPV